MHCRRASVETDAFAIMGGTRAARPRVSRDPSPTSRWLAAVRVRLPLGLFRICPLRSVWRRGGVAAQTGFETHGLSRYGYESERNKAMSEENVNMREIQKAS